MTLKDLMTNDIQNVHFNADDFGKEIVYTPKGGSPITIDALFVIDGTVDEADGRKIQRRTDATLGVLRDATLGILAPVRGDSFVHNSITYEVVAIISQSDDTTRLNVTNFTDITYGDTRKV